METKIAIEKLGRKAGIYEANLSSEESVAALVPSILHDGYRIDILLNCAGVQRRYPSHQFPSQEWNEVGASRFDLPFSKVQPHLRTGSSSQSDYSLHTLPRCRCPHAWTGA